MVTGRPLTRRQEGALRLAAAGLVTSVTVTSMGSLARRGLVEAVPPPPGGKRRSWRVTDAGRAEIKRINQIAVGSEHEQHPSQ